MLRDIHKRHIDYARIAVTDKCSLSCRYCMPQEKDCRQTSSELLRYEELYHIIRILKDLGITKFRFTGGEPLVRKGILSFFENIGLDGFHLTTCLAVRNLDISRINDLKFKSINISIDTLDIKKYRWLTRGGDLELVLDNVKNLRAQRININTVLLKDFNEDEVPGIIDFAYGIGATARFIEKMDFIGDSPGFVSHGKIKESLIRKSIIQEESFREDNSVALYHLLKDRPGQTGFITPVTGPFCANCNKIRIKADGGMKLCLFREDSLNFRYMLRSAEGRYRIKEYIRNLVYARSFEPGINSSREIMSLIGG